MTGDVYFTFTAATLPLAVQTATERWRLFLDEPEAQLPWSTHFTVKEEDRGDDGSELEVRVQITFDRKTVPEPGVAD